MLCNFRILRTLPYSEFLQGPKVYSESCSTRHIQAYSGIFDKDSYNNINFLLFFTLILHTFQQNLKRHIFIDYNDVYWVIDYNVCLNNMQSLKTVL